MKNIMVGLGGLSVSGPLLAHVGEHSHAEWFSVLIHLLSEHALPLLLLAAVLGGLVIRQLLRV